MVNRNKAFIKIILILLILLAFLITTFSFLNPKAQAGNYPLNSKVIFRIIQQLKADYIHSISYVEMINSAIDGINKAIEEKTKIKFNEIPHLDPKKTLTFNIAKAKFEKEFMRVSQKYSYQIDNNTLIYAALREMMSVLAKPPYKDPYSSVLTPKEYKILSEQMAGGNFGGVGIFIELDKDNNNQLTVVEPVENTPAWRAGLKARDQILAINGESTKNMDIEVAAKKIRGRVGSTVVLAIKRNNLQAKDVKIKRAMIHVSSTVTKLINKKVGYIKLRIFGENTKSEFYRAIKRLQAQNVKAIILDLRNNTGGYLNGSIDICSKFLPGGTLVVSVVNYRTRFKDNYYSTGHGQVPLPLVVLVNKFSASASEITAGALQDTKRATIIGEKTFGKGCIQRIFEIPDGGAFKYTNAIYLTPRGRNINEVGIKPDIEISTKPEFIGTKEDIQLRKAVDYLIKNYNI